MVLIFEGYVGITIWIHSRKIEDWFTNGLVTDWVQLCDLHPTYHRSVFMKPSWFKKNVQLYNHLVLIKPPIRNQTLIFPILLCLPQLRDWFGLTFSSHHLPKNWQEHIAQKPRVEFVTKTETNNNQHPNVVKGFRVFLGHLTIRPGQRGCWRSVQRFRSRSNR